MKSDRITVIELRAGVNMEFGLILTPVDRFQQRGSWNFVHPSICIPGTLKRKQ